ncbi:MAG: chemotaxis-specific protein-glutamate methyltransferase CheB [Pseudobdellovibrio sp.]|nr:chemotaxis-specific protein-glutamate methyltransferase CheB [Pseudobdellovibrio sp.]
MIKSKIKTLIVDDSVTIRKVIRHLLDSDPRFEVVAEAANPTEAMKEIRLKQIDLVTMDLHLPQKTGADLIKEYMVIRPIPTVVISSLSPEESHLVLESLENGAVDYIQKPDQKTILAKRVEILDRLYQASQAKSVVQKKQQIKQATILGHNQQSLLVIGASTGGTEAIKTVLEQVGANIPPTLIVQHIPPFFSEAFAQRLNKLFPFEVKEAKNGDRVQENRVLIAPGGMQMKLIKKGKDYFVAIEDSAPVNRHKPSVDFLFDSVKREYDCSKVVGVLLTGMGADGAEGLLKLKTGGAHTIAQDEQTSVVFGMPREAIKRNAAVKVCGLHEMGSNIHQGFTALLSPKKGQAS